MSIRLTLTATLALLASSVAIAQDAWNDVKSWSGTVTIEGTDARSSSIGIYSQKTTYKATGKFTITDSMMPDGMHMMWPTGGAEEMADPKLALAASLGWQAQVEASLEGTREVSSTGTMAAYQCSVKTLHPSSVGLTAQFGAPTYALNISLPRPEFQCTGSTTEALPIDLGQTEFKFTGPRGKVGPISGTKTFTTESGTIKVAFTLAPAR